MRQRGGVFQGLPDIVRFDEGEVGLDLFHCPVCCQELEQVLDAEQLGFGGQPGPSASGSSPSVIVRFSHREVQPSLPATGIAVAIWEFERPVVVAVAPAGRRR